MKNMKNIKNLLFSALLCISLVAICIDFAACKFDEYDLTYPYTSVFFVNQKYTRNVIVGEGLKIGVGITLSGLDNNKEDRIVEYKIDPSLVTDPDQTVLPPEYYKLGHPSQIVIPKGKLKGYLPVVLDSAKFLADSKSLTGEFILPVRLVKAVGIDVIIEEKDFIRISLSYFAKQFGNYYYSGEADKYFGIVLYNSVRYANSPTNGNSFRFLETVGPTTFRMVADPGNSDDPVNGVSFLINVPTTGTQVAIVPDPDSPFEVRASGDCTYDPVTRTFHLEYTWTDGDSADCFAVEKLTFRNRIYDDQGNNIFVNEWR